MGHRDLGLLQPLAAVHGHPADEVVDALLGQGDGVGPGHPVDHVLRDEALLPGPQVLPQLHHVVGVAHPAEGDRLPWSHTGDGRRARDDPVNVQACKGSNSSF